MELGRYIVGLALSSVCFGSVAVGARALRRWLLPAWSGAPAWTAEAIVGLGMVVVALEVVGVIGAFDQLSAVLACGASGLVALAVARRFRVEGHAAEPPPGSPPVGAPAVS